MSTPVNDRWMLEILRRADRGRPVPSTGHVVRDDRWEDEELLACWEAGLLTPGQLQELTNHLAACSSCRRRVSAMIRSGRLNLPEVIAEAPSEPAPKLIVAPSVSVPQVPWWRSRQFYGLAMAACLLVGVSSALWFYSATGPERVLALAESHLRAGRPEAALQNIEPLLAGRLPARLAAQAKTLLGEAGYQAAAGRLGRGDFQGVLDLEERVAQQAGPSGALVNLRLQAERGIPAEVALDRMGTLTDYGYELDGSSPRKALPVLDLTTQRLEKEYRAALATHPQRLDLLLNRGQFLLGEARVDDAKQCFAKALEAFPLSAPARLGLGLAEFELDHKELALAHFRAALAVDSRNVAAEVNVGTCLAAMGQVAEARKHWQRAIELADDPALRQKLKAQLDAVTK